MSKTKLFSTMLGIAAAMLLTTSAQAAYSWTTIRGAGNDDDLYESNYGNSRSNGAVGYVYDISVHNTTGNQWDDFYGDGSNVGDGTAVGSFNGSYNSGTDKPAVNVSFHQAAQYANWLTTDDATQGVYTIDSNTGAVTSVDRSAYSEFYAIPTEDEWYKAAYYDVGDKSYQSWATKDGSEPSEGDWNYGDYFKVEGLQDVGFSPEELNGTHDMMGQTYEWMEESYIVQDNPGGYASDDGIYRSAGYLENTERNTYWGADEEFDRGGFRLVQVPEPGSLALLLAAGSVLLFRTRSRRRA